MKYLYDINKKLILITVFLYFTFWGGIVAHIILGAIQILMSITIMKNLNALPKSIKDVFNTYVITVICVLIGFRIIGQVLYSGLWLMVVFLFTTLLLAIFHMNITYKIKHTYNTEISNSEVK